MADQDYLTPRDFSKNLKEGPMDVIKKGVMDRKSLDDIKAEYITEILQETGGNKRIAAEILKVNPRTLYRFTKKANSKSSF
jgi:DNA-binding NtrC family response regulator